MGGYAPVISPDDDERERQRQDDEYPPAVAVNARSADPRTAALSAPAGMPAYPPPIAPAQSPAQARLHTLTEQGAPPVQPLHGWKKFLDIASQFTKPTQAIEQAVRYRPQREYEGNLKQAEADVAAEQAPEAKEAHTGLEKAQAEEANARAEGLRNPPTKEEWLNVPTLTGPNGEPVEYEKTSGQYRFGDLKGAKALKTPTETQEQNKLAFQAVTEKLDAAGLPTGPKSIDKALDDGLKRGVITAAEHAKARAYQTANPTPATNLQVTIAGAQQKQGFEHTETQQKETYKRYETAQDAEQRLSRMEASYQKALKGDQQAMLALLTDHIGMTLGLQKGARITKDILNEATSSMPWLEKIESKFDSRGYLSGVTLGPEQMAQMLDLGYEARDRAVQGAQDSSQLYGVQPPPGAAEVFGKRKVGEKPALQHGAAGEPPRPAHVPANYVYKENGPKGKGWYKP